MRNTLLASGSSNTCGAPAGSFMLGRSAINGWTNCLHAACPPCNLLEPAFRAKRGRSAIVRIACGQTTMSVSAGPVLTVRRQMINIGLAMRNVPNPKSVSTKMFKRLGEGVTTDQVVKQIRELIESGELRPGDRLPSERTLADRLGISRPSVRTGLRILSAMRRKGDASARFDISRRVMLLKVSDCCGRSHPLAGPS